MIKGYEFKRNEGEKNDIELGSIVSKETGRTIIEVYPVSFYMRSPNIDVENFLPWITKIRSEHSRYYNTIESKLTIPKGAVLVPVKE